MMLIRLMMILPQKLNSLASLPLPNSSAIPANSLWERIRSHLMTLNFRQ